ncbi:hypothetical protein BpHYR1_053289 [Brachionus plicatilis]|uniref:Uncharacterized protein n=1 Tax=Brachionus plicatilis TaxID=10195 RepID=A0A3M7RIJ7_BRAPC|nr:hypothetical protein BpHYR1_053289 [Brachionus plicatilis]
METSGDVRNYLIVMYRIFSEWSEKTLQRKRSEEFLQRKVLSLIPHDESNFVILYTEKKSDF